MGDKSGATKDTQTSLQWTDSDCKKIASKDFFPIRVKDLSVQKQVTRRFLDFYLGGRRDKGLIVEDIVFPVLAILPRSPYDETIIWSPRQFQNDGTLFFLNAEEKLAADVKKIIQSPKKIIRDDEIDLKPFEEEYAGVMDDDDFNVFSPNYMNEYLSDLEIDFNHFDFLMENAQGDGERDSSVFNKNVQRKCVSISDQKDTESIAFLQEIKFDPVLVKVENTTMNYGPVQNAAFINYCDTVLDNWESDAGSRTVLKSFVALVALVLMRATAKGYKHLFTTFHGEKFPRFLRHMSGLKYAPPQKRCLKSAFRTFCRKDNNTPIMFAKLLCLSEVNTDKYLKYVLKNGLLNYTANYGLNLVTMWMSVHTAALAKDDVKRLVVLTTCDETRSSWETLANFLRKYKGVQCQESTYRWARILDSRYFKELSCQANHALAVVLAVFSESMTGNTGVWNATWVRNDDDEQRLKEFAYRQYEKYINSV